MNESHTDPALERTAPKGFMPGVLRRLDQVSSWGKTHHGGRSSNEDHFVVASWKENRVFVHESSIDSWLDGSSDTEADAHLLAVADGMGGHPAGEIASELAIQSLIENLDGRDPEEAWLEWLADAVRSSDQRVIDYSRKNEWATGLGTTLTAALIVDSTLHVAHVGDSRAYLYRSGSVQQLTRDHTLAERLRSRASKDGGKVLPMERLEHVLWNVVGGVEGGVDVETHSRTLYPGDVVLVCSDGLSEALSNKDIARILGDGTSPREKTDALIREALSNEAEDNVCVVVAECEDSSN